MSDERLVFRFPFSPFRLSHATCRTECGGNGREDGDYDVEDLAPSAVVVECSHSGKDPSPCPPLYGRTRSLEDGLNVHLCLVRGAHSCATRGRSI